MDPLIEECIFPEHRSVVEVDTGTRVGAATSSVAS